MEAARRHAAGRQAVPRAGSARARARAVPARGAAAPKVPEGDAGVRRRRLAAVHELDVLGGEVAELRRPLPLGAVGVLAHHHVRPVHRVVAREDARDRDAVAGEDAHGGAEDHAGRALQPGLGAARVQVPELALQHDRLPPVRHGRHHEAGLDLAVVERGRCDDEPVARHPVHGRVQEYGRVAHLRVGRQLDKEQGRGGRDEQQVINRLAFGGLSPCAHTRGAYVEASKQ